MRIYVSWPVIGWSTIFNADYKIDSMLETFILSLERVIVLTLKRYFGVRSKGRRYPGGDNCPWKEDPRRRSWMWEINRYNKGGSGSATLKRNGSV